jgi:hypothetical protein
MKRCLCYSVDVVIAWLSPNNSIWKHLSGNPRTNLKMEASLKKSTSSFTSVNIRYQIYHVNIRYQIYHACMYVQFNIPPNMIS